MKWFLNLATRTKLVIGFGLMLGLLAAVMVTARSALRAAQESQKTILERDFAQSVTLLDLLADLNRQRSDVLEMMLATRRADAEAVEQDLKVRTGAANEAMQRLLDRAQDTPALRRRLDELQQLRSLYQQTRDGEMIPLIFQGKIEEAKKIGLGVQAQRYEKIRALERELGGEAVREAEGAAAHSEQTARESLRMFLVLGLIAMFLGAAMVVSMNRIVARPLREISAVAEKMASGDLTVSLQGDHRRDEVGALVETFRKMVTNLRNVTREIGEGINVLGSSASEILAGAAQVAAGATETATAVSETTTTLEEVRQTAQVSSGRARSVLEAAQRSAQVSDGGRKAVEETVRGMNNIREHMESVAESIVRLSDHSQAIGEIIATVNDLADQSNLLAVNAAIEAAKAGEQGKGFSVVAQEVRSLAEQSKQATSRVRAILGDIQKATSAAVMATEQGSKAVEAGIKQSVQAGEAVQRLAESIAQAAQAATQIAASTEQQVVGMEQIAAAMENVKQATSENVSSTKQAEAAAQNLHGLGQKLRVLVDQYRV